MCDKSQGSTKCMCPGLEVVLQAYYRAYSAGSKCSAVVFTPVLLGRSTMCIHQVYIFENPIAKATAVIYVSKSVSQYSVKVGHGLSQLIKVRSKWDNVPYMAHAAYCTSFYAQCATCGTP